MMNRNIVLFGFMGCGKTTVGAELAANTGRELVDTDKLIEQSEGKSISEIFRLHGENYFRDREHEVCLELSGQERLIISAGGGALTFRRNVEAMEYVNGRANIFDFLVFATRYGEAGEEALDNLINNVDKLGFINCALYLYCL